MRGLLDTSVFIAMESGRRLDSENLPAESLISPVTLAELQVGVLRTSDFSARSKRLKTLTVASGIELLPIDDSVAEHWALLRVHLGESKRRAEVNDLWIAATALAHRIPLYTQDDDFDSVEGIGSLEVIKV